MPLGALLRNRLVFYGEVLRATSEVGAFTHTSSAVARAVAAPLDGYAPPRRILEVGPGTGALTRALVAKLVPGDTLELLEINERFAELLREELVPTPPPAKRGEVGRGAPSISVTVSDIEDLAPGAPYDVIVSSLPFMNFDPEKVRRVLELYEERLAAGGTLSSFDYWANDVRALLARGAERRRLVAVRGVIDEFHARHAHVSRVIAWNLPPATVHAVRRRADFAPAQFSVRAEGAPR